ncbi:MAG: carbohydrate ABC transporter permease [Clostridia bacterium]|nr:carbohydrate ABC transporter permease [Clostridia bacterium]
MEIKKKKRQFKINVYAVIVGVLLALYALSIFFALGWGFITSLKYRTDFEGGNYMGLPNMEHWHKIADLVGSLKPGDELYERYSNFTHLFGNYANAIARISVLDHAKYYTGFNLDIYVDRMANGSFFGIITNTLLYVGGTALFATLAPCIAGYLCAKFKFKFSGIVCTFVLFVMAMPLVGNTTAMLTLLKRLSLYDTIYGMWITHCSFANSYFLIFLACFKGLSNTYAEAAQIDGASYWKVMWQIYVPLASKIFSTIFLLQVVAQYNNYTTSMYYLPTYPTLSYAIWKIQFSGVFNSKPELLATSLMLSLPMLIIFVIFKNKLMGNISLGGVKE